MDNFLISYLKSGKAWLLVGSGLSNAAGYPSWESLANRACDVTHVETRGKDLKLLDKALAVKDFPLVFQHAASLLGLARLRQCLQDILRPSVQTGVYELIARWPIPVYLTTNYDDEISAHLARLGEVYTTCCNSQVHFSQLAPGVSGLVLKLHGDMKSDQGLILTKHDYDAIDGSDEWGYWRTKMTSLFQMNPVIVIGHSLTDPHIRHILHAAKQGAGVHMPVCWIAPNAPPNLAKDLLDLYRIRVISYHDEDGQHRNLVRLIETVGNFLPPRTAIRIRSEIDAVSKSSLGENAAAPGFYVFNTLIQHADFDKRRIDIVTAAIQAVLPKLGSFGDFEFRQALTVAGWPKDLPIESEFEKAIVKRLLKENLLEISSKGFRVNAGAEDQSKEDRKKGF